MIVFERLCFLASSAHEVSFADIHQLKFNSHCPLIVLLPLFSALAVSDRRS